MTNRTIKSALAEARLQPPHLVQRSAAYQPVDTAAPHGRWARRRFGLHAALLTLAVASVYLLADSADIGWSGHVTAWLIVPLTLLLLGSRGAYRRALHEEMTDELLRLIGSTSLAALALLALLTPLHAASSACLFLVYVWVCATICLCASVPTLTIAERRARRSGAECIPTLVIGAGTVGTQVERMLLEQPELGLRVVGFVDEAPLSSDRVPMRHAPVLGAPNDFTAIADKTGARQVIVTFSSSPDHSLVPLIRACEERDIHVALVPRIFESVNLHTSVDRIGRLPVFTLAWVDPKGWQFAVKHTIDRVVGAALLFILSPLLLAIALAIRLEAPGPVFFRQVRIGRDGRAFVMLKFRSMRVSPHPGAPRIPPFDLGPGGVEGEDRRTTVGRVLRRYSLDELPQLINVIQGDMSLIGPRPERPEFVELFDKQVRRYADRHRVKPGISGLAQISGFRGQTSLSERVAFDNYYIKNWTLMLDAKILLRTFAAVVRFPE